MLTYIIPNKEGKCKQNMSGKAKIFEIAEKARNIPVHLADFPKQYAIEEESERFAVSIWNRM